MKRQRFEFSRSTSRPKRKGPEGGWVAEPIDVALVASALAIILWLQLLAC